MNNRIHHHFKNGGNTQVLAIETPDPTLPIRVVQISDPHLFEDQTAKLLGMNTEDSFQAVITLIRKEQLAHNALNKSSGDKKNVEQDKQVALFVATGDIAQGPAVATYNHFLHTMQTLESPTVWLQGNHDLGDLFLNPQYQRANQNVIELGDTWLIIMLNSSKDHAIAGEFSTEELTWLAYTLHKYPQRHTIIAMHHNPIKIDSAWLDALWVTNADAFWQIVDTAPQTKVVIHGHIHQDFEARRGTVKVLACPSTCIQFKPLSDTFALDMIPPGYRWFDLYPDGRFDSGISRLSSVPAGVDPNSSGY